MWSKTTGTALTLAICAVFAGPVYAGGHLVAHLSGEEEVPLVETLARGQANFLLKGASDTLSYRLIVANLEQAFAAHIHCAPEGINGPVGVTLFSGSPITMNGILAQGPILAPNAGNGCGWDSVDALIEALHSGNTYVNVHTTAHPGGEIRGQIR